MANPSAIELHASAAETASDTGDAVDMGATRSCLQLALVVTAVAGTLPTLALVVQTGPSETGPWRTGGTFTTVNTTGKTEKTIAGLDRWVRLVWTITGSAGQSFTFSLDGFAHTLYAEPADLTKTAINAAALSGVDAEILAVQCLTASTEFESACNSAFSMPLTSSGADVRAHVAARAVYHAMNHRGRKPQAGDLIDQLGGYVLGPGMLSAAERFFTAIRDGKLKPVGLVDQTPDDFEGSGYVASGTSRGW